MKQAQILFLAITLFAIVGGIFAFKARTTVPYELCNASSICTKHFAAGVTSIPQPTPWQLFFNATADANSDGLACTNSDHPCTASIYILPE